MSPPSRPISASTVACSTSMCWSAPQGARQSSTAARPAARRTCRTIPTGTASIWRSEEHTSELQSLMRISYAVFCLKKKNQEHTHQLHHQELQHKTLIQTHYIRYL